MKLFSQLSLVALAGALVVVPASANAQRGDKDNRSRSEIARDGRWDDDDWNRRNGRDARPGRRVGQDEAWLRKHRARQEEWCRRHRNDRRCDDLYRRGNDSNWCWDTNRDGRCDYVDNRRNDTRRDSRSGVIRNSDRGPEWERWLRENGRDLVPLMVPTPR